MTFQNYLRWSSTFLILTGLGSILITGSYSVAVGIGMFITLLHGILGEKLPKAFPIPKWVWNGLALFLFSYLFYDTFWGTADLVGNGIQFVIYLQMVKLLSPKTSRDWMQIYTLSFLHLLAATVITSDIAFAIPFLIYVVLATWTLALFNIQQQQEEIEAQSPSKPNLRLLLRSKEIITRRFLGVTSGLALLIIVLTLIFFFSIPRFSMGNFLKRIGPRQTISGFSDEVELGTIGSIKKDDSISFRVELPEGAIDSVDIERLYWRGTAADSFDGRKWFQSIPDRQRVYIDPDLAILNINSKNFPGGKHLEYKVFLEALSTPIILGADRLLRLTWDKPFVERFLRRGFGFEKNDLYETFRFLTSQNYTSDLTYQAESLIGEPEREILEKDASKYPYLIRLRNLQLPPLDPEVKTLLQNISLPLGGSPLKKVLAIQDFLEKNYQYTLDVQDFGTQDPLRFFFIEKKQGHCEYFSTAFIIALRAHGIPSREVVGFRGGEYNPFGRYLAVRQSDAHSWVEVFFPKFGWIRFDPSPLDRTVHSFSQRFQALFQVFDFLRLRWNKYIIEYDLGVQTQIAEKLGRKMFAMVRRPSSSPSTPFSIKQLFPGWKFLQNWPLSILFFSFLGIVLGMSLIRRWFHRKKKTHFLFSRFGEVQMILSQKGFEKKLSQTPQEFIFQIEMQRGSIPPLQKLTHLYYAERFGNFPCPDSQWNQHLQELHQHFQQKNVKSS